MANGQFFSGLVRLYHATFGRQSDMGGVGFWASQLAKGDIVFLDVVEAFMASDEFLALYPEGLDNEQFVTHLYHNVLKREPDEQGLAHWLKVLEEGNLRSKVLLEFVDSDEFVESTEGELDGELALAEQAELDAVAELESELEEQKADETLSEFSAAQYQVFVDHLYDAAFNRDPDERGLGYWVSQLAQNKVDLSGVAKAFLESAEFADIYGHDLPDSEFIEALYHNVLGRDSDEAGHHFWMGQLVSGVARYDVLEAFALSLENTQGDTGSEVEVTGAIDSGEALL